MITINEIAFSIAEHFSHDWAQLGAQAKGDFLMAKTQSSALAALEAGWLKTSFIACAGFVAGPNLTASPTGELLSVTASHDRVTVLGRVTNSDKKILSVRVCDTKGSQVLELQTMLAPCGHVYTMALMSTDPTRDQVALACATLTGLLENMGFDRLNLGHCFNSSVKPVALWDLEAELSAQIFAPALLAA